ncbi:MAG: hypothetical protein HN474_00205 [Nitrospina sp.]|nr:hypothetical protein [Nitrospina sp.]
MNYRKWLSFSIAMLMLFAIATPGFAADVNELERRLNIVSDELDRMKSSSGGGGLLSRTTVHGYGETHWKNSNEVGDMGSYVDQHRFVIGVHSEITDWIHLNAEIDFEHAASELEFEFGHLDFLVSEELNFRAGTMLMPMGNLNEFHEPNRFYTVERPDFHVKLIPSTWQQAGFGVHGATGDISYRAYLTNAVSALDLSRKFRPRDFIRKGRSQITGLTVNNMAVSARVEKKVPGGQAGFSIYTGGTGGEFIDDNANLTMTVLDYKTKRGPWEWDLGVMKAWLADTDKLNAACANGRGLACSDNIPKSAFGLLGTLAVHVPELMGKKTIHDIIPFIQYQKIRPNDKLGDASVEGGSPASNPKRNFDVFTFGVAYKPHPMVALKTSYRSEFKGGTEESGAVNGDAGTTVNVFDFGVAYQY